jgi:polysaccharide pyruvyl transferase CsaB
VSAVVTTPGPQPIDTRERAGERLRVVLSGYYGYNNLGDEAILVALVQQLRAMAPDVDLVALSGAPERTASALGIRAVNRLAVPAVWQALRDADLFISGGGSLLQDVTGLGSVPYYLGLMRLAKLAGARTMMLGQGVGPLGLPTSRWLVGLEVRGLDAVTVRDEDSRELLARCGVPLGRIELTADPVLALAPASPERADEIAARLGLVPGRPTIAVSVRNWNTWYERQLKAFSAVLAQRAEAWDAQILLLPFHRPGDEVLSDELRYCLETRPEAHRPHVAVLEEDLAPQDMMALLGRVDLLVGMRLHALIMAAAVGTPAVGVVYDPKIAAFAARAGFPTVESVTALEQSDRLAALLQRTWEERGATRATLRERQVGWRAQAARNAEIAIDLARTAHARRA